MAGVFEEQVLLNGCRVTIVLDPSGILRWESVSQGRQSNGVLDIPREVIGIARGASSLSIFAFAKEDSACCGGQPTRTRRDYVFEFNSSDANDHWSRAIQRILENSGRPKKLLVLVNPFGGKGLGKKTFVEHVEPMLKLAGIQFTMRETQFQSHAKDLAKSFDMSHFDGIVCVSGDGVLAEVLNGLLERADWERAVKMPLGIVPAVSNNVTFERAIYQICALPWGNSALNRYLID